MRHAALFTPAIAICLLAISPSTSAPVCRNLGSPSANEELVRKFYDAINTHRVGTLDAVLAPNWVDVPSAPGQGPGAAGLKDAFDDNYRSFPDFTAHIQDVIAAGDKVVVRSELTMTQKGAFVGIPATNKPITFMATDIHQICDGQIVQTWHLEDWLGALFQLGVLPQKS